MTRSTNKNASKQPPTACGTESNAEAQNTYKPRG